MPVHESSKAFRDELRSPSVLARDDFRAASKGFRPTLQRISQQVSVLQQILVEVEEDEENGRVVGKLEAMRQRLRALQRQHDTAEKAYSTLALSYRQFAAQAEELCDLIDEEAGE